MRVEIIEVDNDYRSYSGSEIKEFFSLKEAQKYCDDESWTGYSYIIGWYEGKNE